MKTLVLAARTLAAALAAPAAARDLEARVSKADSDP